MHTERKNTLSDIERLQLARQAFADYYARCFWYMRRDKDQGYTPDFLLDQLNRNAAFTQEEIQRLDLAVSQTLSDLKRQWCAAMEQAGRLLTALPADEVGCLYLDR